MKWEMNIDYEKKFQKLLKGYKNSLDYILETNQPAYNNPLSPSQIERKYIMKYILVDSDNFPLFVKVVREAIASRKALPKDKIIESAYQLLHIMGVRLPLKTLVEIIESGHVPDGFTFDPKKQDWAGWEQEDLKNFAIDLTKEQDLEKMLRRFTGQFDDFLMTWRYDYYSSHFRIEDLSEPEGSSKRLHYIAAESTLFLAVTRFPGLEKWVVEYVEKITEANRSHLLLTIFNSNIVRARGGAAAAVMVLLNPGNDEKLLAYLRTVDTAEFSVPADVTFRQLKAIWREAAQQPDLPVTYAAYPQLKS